MKYSRKDLLDCPNGLYRIFWKESSGGGSSEAAIGLLHDGIRWVAPINWTSEITFTASTMPKLRSEIRHIMRLTGIDEDIVKEEEKIINKSW